ncbi:hypothetical protein L249_0579, partial [Ophiocordyceps polyrhachis-furcata BCC 54312]
FSLVYYPHPSIHPSISNRYRDSPSFERWCLFVYKEKNPQLVYQNLISITSQKRIIPPLIPPHLSPSFIPYPPDVNSKLETQARH